MAQHGGDMRDAEAYRTAVFLEERPDGDFVIVTAWDPPGRPRGDVANRRLDAELREALRAAGAEPRRMTGCSPDLAHREPGWAAAVPVATALEVARRFDQAALYAVAAGRLLLVWCHDGSAEDLGDAAGRFGAELGAGP